MRSKDIKRKMIFSLHVRNLPKDMTETKLLSLFRKYGKASSVYLNETNPRARFAFVDYTDYNEATEAIKNLDRVPPHNLWVSLSKRTVDELQNIGKEEAKLIENEEKPILLCRGRGRQVPFPGPPPSSLKPQRTPSSNYYRGNNYDYESESYNITFMDDYLSDQIDSVSMKVDYIPQSYKSVMRGRGLYQPSDFIDEINIKNPLYQDKISNSKITIGPSKHEFSKGSEYFDMLRINKFENFYSRKGRHNIINTLDGKFECKVNGILGEDTIFGSVIVNYEVNQDLVPEPDFKPSLGEMVYAMMDSKWFRGYVTFKKEEIIKVALIDVGKVVKPEAICPMPSEIQNIPETAVIITFKTSLPTIGEVVEMNYFEFDGCVYANPHFGQVEINRWFPTIEDVGVSAVNIPTKNEVFIASFQSPKSLYVYSVSDVVPRMEFTIDLFSYAAESKPIQRKPFFGEILCCRYPEDNRFYRAQVIKKKNDRYIVSFIDYGNISEISLNDMKPLPEHFKNVPAFCVKIALNGVSGSLFNENSTNLLNGHVFDKKKFILEYDHLCDAKLISESHNSLNNKLEELQNYSNVEEDFFMFENLKFDKWQIGQNLKLFGVSSLAFNSYLVINSESPTFNSIKNMTEQINKYCENHEYSVYRPRSNEICLIKYKEKYGDIWCRAAFLNTKRTHGYGEVYLVDYGNTNRSFPLSDVRPIDPEFMKFPAACSNCEIYGLDNGYSDEVKDAIKDLLTEEAFEGIVVDHEYFIVYVPAVNEILSKFNLPAINPPKVIADLI